MPDHIQICNQALALAGGAAITSFDDGSAEADYCRTFYEPTVRAYLEDHPWNFAEATVTLAREATPIGLDFRYSYALPNDLIAVRGIMRDGGYRSHWTYEIRGSSLCTNEPTPAVRYVARAPEQRFSPYFVEALSYALAAKLAMALAESDSKANFFEVHAREKLAVARSRNSAQDSPEYFDTSLLVRGRY